MNTVRKNITMPLPIYEIINAYAKKQGKSFSEFVRDSAIKAINNNEKLSLLEYLNENCTYVDEIEQNEIDSLHIDFDNLEGKELTLHDLLQN